MNLLQSDMQMIIHRLAWMLVHSLWQGGIVAAGLLVILRFSSQGAARLRYLVCCTALALIPLAAVVTYVSERTQPRFETADTSATPHLISPLIANVPPLQTVLSTPATIVNHEGIMQTIVLLWAGGVFIFAFRHLLGWISLRWLKNGDRIRVLEPTMARLCHLLNINAKRIQLIETKRFSVPAVVGALRPIILFPVGLLNEISPQQVEAILLHELAHIVRYDYLANLIQVTIESLMFYHPAVWWISSQIRQEREHCCDDLAVANCADARSYASALLALEEHRRPSVFPVLAATDGNLLHRLRRLLHLPANSNHRPARSLAAALLVAICVSLPFAAIAQQKPASAPATTAAEVPAPSEILPEDLIARDEPYRITNQDLLDISIENLAGKGIETVKTDARVDSEGKVSVPLLGNLAIVGLTANEAEKAVAKAYTDKKIGSEVKLTVSIKVQEMRGRTFSIMGRVTKPGQYAIVKANFHVSEALTLAWDVQKKDDRIFVIRTASPNGKKRELTIPTDKLKAGDPSVDVIIRTGDLILVTDQYNYMDLVADQTMCLYQHKSIDLTELENVIAADPAYIHQMTVLRVSAASPKITDERMLEVVQELNQLVTKYNLAGVVDTEIHRRKKITEPNSLIGEYYLSGQVPRPGVYSLNGRKITLKQAIVAAGADDADTTNYYLSVIRRDGDKESWPLVNARYVDLFSGAQSDIYLRPDDIVSVHKNPWPAARSATTESNITK